MDRYQYVNKTKSSTGKRIYSTSRYPVLEPQPDDLYIFAKDEMRLDNLAFKYYGNAGLWWAIALANNLGKGTLVVNVGQRIRIPGSTTMSNITKQLNSSQTDV